MEWPFCILVVCGFFYCGGLSQWVGLDVWLVKVSWLGKLASVFWCKELDFFSLQCNGVSSSEFWDGSICLVCLWVACILTLKAMFLCCWRICMVCLALELWLLVGVWFWCRYGGFWMFSYYLMFPVVRSSLVFSGFGLKPPASGFQSYSSSSLKSSLSIQHSFQRQWTAFHGAWCPLLMIRSCFVEFAQHSNVLLMNLWGRKWYPRPIPPPS